MTIYDDPETLVGFDDIAKRLGRTPRELATVAHRGDGMPPPRWYVNGAPVWDWREVGVWATETGGIHRQEAA